MRNLILTLMVIALFSCGGNETESGTVESGPEYLDTYTFKGKIDNQYPVTMELRLDGEAVSGSYFYDKYKKPLVLKGNFDPETGLLTLTERNKRDKITGSFEGELEPGGSFKGQWENADQSKLLSFDLNDPSAVEKVEANLTAARSSSKGKNKAIPVNKPQSESATSESKHSGNPFGNPGSSSGNSGSGSVGNTASNVTSVPATNPGDGTPLVGIDQISFSEETWNFGTITEGERVRHTYTIRNNGQNPLYIENVKPSCGCTTPNWSREAIPAGGKGKIDVEFDSKRKKGIQMKTITISFKNVEPRHKILRLTGEVLER